MRTENHTLEILDFIKSKWQLSVNEEDLLDSLLVLFSAQKTEKLKQIEYLLNEEDGWHVSLDNGYTNSNIVEEIQFSEWTELFNTLSVQERDNILKGWYDR